MKQKNKGRRFENTCQKTIGSGNLWFEKGDLNFKDFCVEVKYTDKKSFSLTNNIVEKIWCQALDSQKEPLIIIGLPRNDNEMFIIEGRISVKRKQK